MKRARVWRFGDNVNTDLIIPGKYLDNYDPEHLARHAMEGASKDFASRVSEGDVVVAGSNFGCGSSREQAVTALKHAGVRAVVAKSFARIFYRNAVNLGLTVIVSPDAVDLFHDGDAAMFSGDKAELTTADGNRKAHLEPVPPHLKKILDKGGLIPYIKEKLKSQ